MTVPAHIAQARSKDAVATAPLPIGQLRLIGAGQPLDPGIRQTMEGMLQADFSDVRVYEGLAAQALGALAFTVGETLCFAPGLYDPTTRGGLELLGHELTHVVQQREGRVENPYGNGLAIVQDPALEAEADAMGRWIADAVWSPARAGQPAVPHGRWGEVRGRAGRGAPSVGSPIQRMIAYDEAGVAVGIESSPKFRDLLKTKGLEIKSDYWDPSDKIAVPSDVPLLFTSRRYTFKVAGCLPDMLLGTPSHCHTIALVGHANAGLMCTGSGRATGLDLETLPQLENLLCIVTLRNVGQVAALLKEKLTTAAYGYRHVFLLGCSSSNDYDVPTSTYNRQSLADQLARLLKPAIVYGFDDEVGQVVQLHPLTHLDEISAYAAANGVDGTRHELKIICSKKSHKRDFLKNKTKVPQVAMDYFKYT